MICSSVYRLFFILSSRLDYERNSSFQMVEFFREQVIRTTATEPYSILEFRSGFHTDPEMFLYIAYSVWQIKARIRCRAAESEIGIPTLSTREKTQ